MGKRKKIIKKRGSKTCGHGMKKKHRGKGSRGGKGMAGLKDHKKFYMLKYMPDHIGKYGFKSLKKRKIIPEEKAINLRDIVKIASGKEIDVVELGFDKVLGAGKIEKPLIIKAKSFSKKAEEKILAAGGKAIKV
ncbi:MAG TPA: 50S ribosomal protein L15 [Candidatus Desulfofervidus auxilii]|uniref:Large ribosomal subunit protein uL15 n=1 Tax=Desulfofervidus auxilii TaxID=1621989 RepID=A0A7V0IAN2_DESA2|nr:50S ribosomal protein L15 [Candidatus Desulfofervidus auxilii]